MEHSKRPTRLMRLKSARSTTDRCSSRSRRAYLPATRPSALPDKARALDTGSSSVALPAEVVFTLWRTGSLRSSDFIGNQVFVLADGRKLPSLTFKIRE